MKRSEPNATKRISKRFFLHPERVKELQEMAQQKQCSQARMVESAIQSAYSTYGTGHPGYCCSGLDPDASPANQGESTE